MNISLDMIADVAGAACLIIGAYFMLSSAVGLVRMPDFFARLHPAGISDTSGILFLVLGMMLLLPIGVLTIKLVLFAVLALITGATACHSLAKAAKGDDK